MPFHSDKQRRYIYAQAAAGKKWAIAYLRDMGLKPPGVREAVHARMKSRK